MWSQLQQFFSRGNPPKGFRRLSGSVVLDPGAVTAVIYDRTSSAIYYTTSPNYTQEPEHLAVLSFQRPSDKEVYCTIGHEGDSIPPTVEEAAELISALVRAVRGKCFAGLGSFRPNKIAAYRLNNEHKVISDPEATDFSWQLLNQHNGDTEECLMRVGGGQILKRLSDGSWRTCFLQPDMEQLLKSYPFMSRPYLPGHILLVNDKKQAMLVEARQAMRGTLLRPVKIGVSIPGIPVGTLPGEDRRYGLIQFVEQPGGRRLAHVQRLRMDGARHILDNALRH